MRGGQIVEVADVKDLFARPQHPYTRQLMQSLPSLHGRGSFEVATA
jgi:peptide/nickel transport system ATP-binding protein/oligopeptide transport system ATP-binding protein